MKTISPYILFLGALAISSLLACVLFPGLDLKVSGLFYKPDQGFFLSNSLLLIGAHLMAYYGARGLALFLAAAAGFAFIRQRSLFEMDGKAWLFLFLALIIGPGLIANVGFKDHWGRARPREVTEFGGSSAFSSALSPQPFARKNGSFVSGDGAFGFFLPSFCYVVPTSRSRRVFWSTLGLGSFLAFARVLMGAHFLSDVLCAALFMLASSTLLYGGMFGWKALAQKWKYWLSSPKSTQQSS